MLDGAVSWVSHAGHEVLNYTNWLPEERRHQVHLMPPISVWDLSYSFYCAAIISLVRYYVVNPFFTWLAIRKLRLPQHSLLTVNAQRSPSAPDYIPPLVFPLLDAFLTQQAADMKRAKRSGKADVIVESRLNSQRHWKEVERNILTRLNRESSARRYAEEDVRRWLSLYQREQRRGLRLKKFAEAGWIFSFYTFIWIFGLITISDKPYFTQSVHLVWADYPVSPPSADVRWYYLLSMGHYLHLFFASFVDIRRKDFVEMLVHHVVTLLLLTFSWMVNFSRIGALVLVVHDGCDVFLQLGKLLHYMHYKALSEALFVVFAVCFFVCRLVIFPSRILYTSLVWTVTEGGYKPWFVYYFFNGLLLALQALHLFWFSFIFSMAWRWATTGEISKDARSDTDEGSASEADMAKTVTEKANGSKKGK